MNNVHLKRFKLNLDAECEYIMKDFPSELKKGVTLIVDPAMASGQIINYVKKNSDKYNCSSFIGLESDVGFINLQRHLKTVPGELGILHLNDNTSHELTARIKDKNMKHTAILSNPPYTIGNDRTGWKKFLHTFLDQAPDYLSSIVPIALLYGDYEELRSRLVSAGLKSYRILPSSTFDGANVETVVVTCVKGYVGPVEVQISNGHKLSIEQSSDPVYLSEDKEFTQLLAELQKIKKKYRKFPKLRKNIYTFEKLEDKPFKNSMGVLVGVNQNIARYKYVTESNAVDSDLCKHKIAFKYSPTHGGDPYKTITFGYEQPFYVEPGCICNGDWYKYMCFNTKEECVNIISYLTSPLVSFILLHTRSTTQSRDNPVFQNVPLFMSMEELRTALSIDVELYNKVISYVENVKATKTR